MDEKLGCVLVALDKLNSGKAKLYYFAGAGFSETQFICLGSGDTYALPLADVLLNTNDITTEKVAQLLPLIFLLVEKVTVSVAGGPDIFIIKDGEQPKQMPTNQVEAVRCKVSHLLQDLLEAFNKITEIP